MGVFSPLVGIIGLLFFSFVLLGIFPRKVLFFPDNIPNQAIVYIEYPQGTDIGKTNKATLFVENQVIDIMKKYIDPKTKENYLAESIVSQVGVGAGNPNVDAGSQAETPYKGKVTVNFSEFKFRRDINTADILDCPIAVGVAKEQLIDIGNQWCALPTSRHVAGAKIAHNWNASQFGNDRRLAQLQRARAQVAADDVHRAQPPRCQASTSICRSSAASITSSGASRPV